MGSFMSLFKKGIIALSVNIALVSSALAWREAKLQMMVR